ncbi:golgin subfamily A member 2 [Aplysia californica]|uniref:Golgin subfamily A member 2 n=1 Tax=Aplysia californica TaxID=6500 RepID=A0ABM0KBH1_APLCA|nr:golgin subfamily A member 2 [Aplysia californica]
MAELYAQQLSSESENTQGSVEILNSLQKERDSLLVRLHKHEELTQKLQSERDQVTDQYQQYTEQLRHQSQQVTQQVTVLTEEREQLLNKQHELEGAVHELQRKLEDVENAPRPEVAAPAPQAPSIPPEVTAELERLRIDVREATVALETQVRDNMQLGRLLEEKEERVSNLERSVEEMGEQAGDKVQLLESIQSDRTALSRALSQNKELKTQLEELQQGFVKISTDNMELVTRLQTEQHSVNELSAKLAQQEDELTQIREVLSSKEGEVTELKSAQQFVEKEMYQQDQMTDRLRHYEAQAQLVDTLQNELTAAQDMMEALTTQNSELRTMLIKATEVKSPSRSESAENGDSEGEGRNEIMESLQATIAQLETERTQLYESLKEQRQLSDSLGIKIADLQEEVIRKTEDNNPDSERISRSEYQELKTAMELIQQKYMHVMQDKAELSDKADQLEHLVLQLQGESDTIGEYISLYHHQRALLQQRETQKNDYIAQLARDREQLQDKLGELQVLVMQLLGERNMLHSYHEETTTHSPQHHHPDMAVAQQQRPQKQQHQALSNGTMNAYENDWPDYTSSESDTDSEVEPIVGGQQMPATPDSEMTPQSSPPDSPRDGEEVAAHRLALYNDQDSNHDASHMDADSASVSSDQKHSHRSHGHSHHHPHHSNNHHHNHHHPADPSSSSFPAPAEEDHTAHKILSLLTELGHSHMVDQVPLIDRNFLPCKFCKGAVQIV